MTATKYTALAAQAGAMRRSGSTYGAIARVLHVSPETASRAARCDGCGAQSVVAASPVAGALFERAQAMRADGMSFSQIGAELGVTKNALIGKFHRAWLCEVRMPAPPPPLPSLTDADHDGCRYIAGDSRPLRPGMYCCAPCVKETDPMTGELRTSSYCAEHWTLCHTATQGKSRWTPERSRKHAALMRRKFMQRSAGS